MKDPCLVLKAADIDLELDGDVILRDLSLEIRDGIKTSGHVAAIMGPSGIGKTRLFRILSGLDIPNHGRVMIGPDQTPVAPGMVGVVAQDYPLFEHRTVLGNLVLAAISCGVGPREAKDSARVYLQRFRLEDRAGSYPCQISGGQRQRVAIAQQFLCSEHVVLMDEPFSGLDPLAIDGVCEMIREAAAGAEMHTMVVVTHDIHAACAVADVIWLLGRDRNVDGSVIPGARIQREFRVDFQNRDLIAQEVRECFASL